MSSWPEISIAAKENRHELILSGAEISNRIEADGVDSQLYKLVGLNFLNISQTCLEVIPDEISKLSNLQSLLLHSNSIEKLPKSLNKLSKLKLLDVSRNNLKEIEVDFSVLECLTSLNLSVNGLTIFPSLSEKSKLTVLDLSSNKLSSFPDICQVVTLSEVRLNKNEITDFPHEIGQLSNLKSFDLSDNKVKEIPYELSENTKLKELRLQGNPISDRRLLKLIDQCKPKQVLDYVSKNGKKSENGDKGKAKGKKGKQTRKDSHHDDSNDQASEDGEEFKYKIIIPKEDTEVLVVRQTEPVKTIRPYILCCTVTGLKFTVETFKKFIQMQTRLHDSAVCEKRTASTLATHDLKKVMTTSTVANISSQLNNMELNGKNNKEVNSEKPNGAADGDKVDTNESSVVELFYDAKTPTELILKPLGSSKECSGAQLFKKLQAEADQLRRDKKRNVYSGVHKYLCLLEGKPLYPCLLNAQKNVISFPPITNSEITRMSIESTEMLLEATSSSSQDHCRRALDAILLELLTLGVTETPGTVTVCKVRVTDTQGNLKVVYPSRADLKYQEAQSVKVIRE